MCLSAQVPPMLVKVSVGSKSFPVKIGKEEGSISTLGELKTRVSQEVGVEAECLKIIHRGKNISGADDMSLLQLNIKENDKILIMGKVSMALKDDPGFSALVSYEKTHLVALQKHYVSMERDLDEMERNFLEVDQSLEMVKRMEKRQTHFCEVCMKHLETIDGMSIIGELITENQAVRNREKRKGLIDGIHSLLNQNDKQIRRLEEYKKKLMGEIVS